MGLKLHKNGSETSQDWSSSVIHQDQIPTFGNFKNSYIDVNKIWLAQVLALSFTVAIKVLACSDVWGKGGI